MQEAQKKERDDARRAAAIEAAYILEAVRK
jgi:hypothetical protein